MLCALPILMPVSFPLHPLTYPPNTPHSLVLRPVPGGGPPAQARGHGGGAAGAAGEFGKLRRDARVGAGRLWAGRVSVCVCVCVRGWGGEVGTDLVHGRTGRSVNPLLKPSPSTTHSLSLIHSAEVKAQLVRGLLTAAEAGPHCPAFPQDFLKALLDGLDNVDADVPRIAALLFSDLLAPLVPAHCLSDPGVAAHVGAIQLLAAQHKGCAHAFVTGVANFTLPPQGVPMPTINPRFPMLQGPSRLQRHGRALEGFTTLGILFRLGFSAEDPQVLGQFENLRTRTRADLESTVNGARAALHAHHGVLVSLLETLLRVKDGGVKEKVVGWLCEALALNVEAEKGRPDPRKKASDVFLINLASVLLRMAGRFVSDPKKRTTADLAAFVAPSAAAVAANGGSYPADLTRLKPEEEEGAGAPMDMVGGGQEGGGAPVPSFLTQCFFLAWRALHLGPVQAFGHRTSNQRYLGHLQVGLGGCAEWGLRVVGGRSMTLNDWGGLCGPMVVDGRIHMALDLAHRMANARMRPSFRSLTLPTHFPNTTHPQRQMNQGGGERVERAFNQLLQQTVVGDIQLLDPELLEKVSV